MDEVVVMDGGVAIALLAIGNLLDGMEFLANDCKKVLFGYQSISSEADNEEETAGTTGTNATSTSGTGGTGTGTGGTGTGGTGTGKSAAILPSESGKNADYASLDTYE